MKSKQYSAPLTEELLLIEQDILLSSTDYPEGVGTSESDMGGDFEVIIIN